MFKPLLLAAILATTVLPAAQQAHAEGISIDLMPGVSLRIGDRDNRAVTGTVTTGAIATGGKAIRGAISATAAAAVTTGTAIAGATATTGANTITIMKDAIVNTTGITISTTGRKRKSTTTIMTAIVGAATAMTTAINDDGPAQCRPALFSPTVRCRSAGSRSIPPPPARSACPGFAPQGR